MEKQIFISGTTVNELVQEIARAISQELASAQSSEQPEQDGLLSREEAAKLLHITLPTLRLRTKEGKLRGYRIGGRVLYRRSEIIQALRGDSTPEVVRP